MFKSKKKSKLPARPIPPSWEEMEEDLRVVAKEDFIFTLKAESEEKEEIEKVSNGAEEGEDVTEAHIFAHAVTFVEKNDELVHNMRRLDEAREKLEDVSSSLEKTVAKVKEQALVAMDGY
ncbi:UPF0449 protein C19orf25-like [Penaeus chinensis]|uniref:UPF0449 protein C19orf25-like n=1 Tax=Penaeus chinensis TaxID=139456 RepID=UPI001FB82E39|nr:UPF0449 protein C19orf25-like [Penaeus chinensis]